MDKYIGKKLEGRYELLELIGFGGMAIVFKAKDILEDKFVAIKILKDEYLSSEDFKRRFRNESKAIAVLSHPSIVKVFDVNFSDNIQYIVMEYIDGITLKEYIGQQGKVNWKESIHFTVQILRALQHAHDNGIVHRDVKPQNVMLLEDGTIKVMDFGIARFARENGKTLSDKAIGSVHYISPEQAKGEVTDEKTDIYAVGVMLYEMLTGQVPFDGETPVGIAIKQMQMEPKRPSEVNPDIPIGLEEIILRAMQKDPQLRYQTASEMLKDIEEFKQNPTVVFEYKYLNRDGTTKYFDKLDKKGTTNIVPTKQKPAKKSYTMNILAGVAATTIVVAVIALIFLFNGIGKKTPDVILTNIVGMTVSQAQTKMKDVRITVIKEELSDKYEKGLIISQNPEGAKKVKVGSEVKVVVSLGFESKIMPDMVNEEISTAKTKLEALGLDVDQVSRTDENVTEGHIISTDPTAGAEVQKGDKVTLYVSLGVPEMPVTVPMLIGKTEMEARTLLLNKGLSIGSVKSVDSIEKQGTILKQDPPPNERVSKGTKIVIETSNGIVPPTSSQTSSTQQSSTPSSSSQSSSSQNSSSRPTYSKANIAFEVKKADVEEEVNFKVFING
ncbi:MAG: Stk1 family PASTA domain-containing Ser/Thr kinase, partial [Oscillospiraceae bacterium]